MIREDEEWTKSQASDAHVTPRNIQEVQASKLGDAPASPLHQQKYQVPQSSAPGLFQSMRYIFIASYDMCYSWSVFVFAFSFLLFCLL